MIKHGGFMSKVVVFKERKTWSWVGRPERFFQDHKVNMDGFKVRYEIY